MSEQSNTLFSVVNDTSKYVTAAPKSITKKRDESAVMMHVMEEVGELALEVAIHNGTSYKKPGEDGVVGEAIDSIICLMDLIYVHNPNITEKDLVAIATKKCQKWRNKTAG